VRASFSPGYVVPLPEGHPFPIGKFAALHEQLLAEGLLRPADVLAPQQADWRDLALVHRPEYLGALADGGLERAAERRLGLPCSPALLRRSRLAVQGTIDAALMALEDGIAANLAGGTHHAFPDHGEGFCVLNDVAVAIRVLQRSLFVRRVLVVDLDVHQGNGTAAIFAGDADVFTFSIHGERNFPFRKSASSLDVGLPDGTGDGDYLASLATHLGPAIEAARPELVVYLAGVDVVKGDRFGRLALTPRGLFERDRMVLEAVARRGLPVVLLLSGGYAATPLETAALHAIAHRVARQVLRPN
jgi:acetoin utilization deacetylase AcuC-like enzyme